MALDPDRLRVLVEVAHAGSIAAAARRMGFTASALSQQVAKLERAVGDRLIDRGPTGVRLTATGAMLVEHGERVLGALHDAEEAVAAARGVPREHLSLGTFASAGQAVVPTALARFRRMHPHVRLTLLDIEPPDGYGLVTAGRLDLLITHRYPGMALPPAPGLDRVVLMTDPLRLVLPTTHPLALADSGPVPLRSPALADAEWISGRPGVPNRVALETVRVRPRVAYETHDYGVTLALVRAGIGVALMPATTLPDRTDGYVVRDLDRPVAREILLVRRPAPRSPVSDMSDLLRA